jgi:hypothetical protein
MIKVENQSDLMKKKKLPTSNFETSDLYKPTTTTKQNKNSHLKKSLTYFLNFSLTDLKKTQHSKKKKKKNRKIGCSFQICRTLSYANSKFANLMIKVGNQSDLKKKKKLPTSNSETSDLCKPTITTEVNFSRTDLKKTQYWKKKKKQKNRMQFPNL